MLKFLFKNNCGTLWTIAVGLVAYAIISALLGVCLYALVFSNTCTMLDKIVAVIGVMVIVVIDMLLEQVHTWRRAIVVFLADVLSLALPVWLVIHWCIVVNL